MTLIETTTLIGMIKTAFPAFHVQDNMAQVWQQFLADVEPSVVQQALTRYMRESGKAFPPAIPELLALCATIRGATFEQYAPIGFPQAEQWYKSLSNEQKRAIKQKISDRLTELHIPEDHHAQGLRRAMLVSFYKQRDQQALSGVAERKALHAQRLTETPVQRIAAASRQLHAMPAATLSETQQRDRLLRQRDQLVG